MRKAKTLIRKGRDGFELNWGTLVVGTVNGVHCISEDWRFEQLGYPFTVPEPDPETEIVPEVPEFNLDIKVMINNNTVQIDFFVMSKDDIKPLAASLAKHPLVERVDVCCSNVILQMWKKGEPTGEPRTLDHWYDGLTAEQIEASRF